MKNIQKIMVYVMVRPFDPSGDGVWGCCNCMGQKRGWHYDAVIGIGGVGAEEHEFAGEIKWIGIYPHEVGWKGSGPKIAFEHFRMFDVNGPKVKVKAPRLASRIRKSRRGFMNLTALEFSEAEKILDMASNAPPSKVATVRRKARFVGRCAPKASRGRKSLCN